MVVNCTQLKNATSESSQTLKLKLGCVSQQNEVTKIFYDFFLMNKAVGTFQRETSGQKFSLNLALFPAVLLELTLALRLKNCKEQDELLHTVNALCHE